jgi:hypothetical protein
LILFRICPDLLVERSAMQENGKRWDRFLAPAMAPLAPIGMNACAGLDFRYGQTAGFGPLASNEGIR